MKYFLLAIMLMTSSSFLYGQSLKEETLRKTLDTFMLAISNNDMNAASRLLTDNYRLTGGLLTCITNKTQRLSGLQSGQIKYEPFNLEDKQNRLYISDTSADLIAQTAVTIKTCDTGKEYKARSFFLHFVKKGELWRLSLECIGRNCWR